MKKIITVLSVLCMLFVFAGCNSRTVKDTESGIQSAADSVEDKVESGITGSHNSSNNTSDNNSSHNGSNNNSGTTTTAITEAKAKEIAFKHADINEADAYDIEVELEKENGVSTYEISFETDSAEYDYHIHADTGEIISSSKGEKKHTGSH